MSVRLHHQSLGSGPPLIILHGLFGSGTNWRSIARGLESCRRVHLLDLRNHGESPHHDTMDYPSLAADVAAFMDREALAEADIIGHSMGGKTAMRLALDSPQRVSRLMVVDIAPAPSGSDHLPLIDAMLKMDVGSFSRRAQADAALSGVVDEAPLRAFLLRNLKSSGGGLHWRINLPAIRGSMPALLGFPLGASDHYDGATLFVRGGDSGYLRDEHIATIRRHFPAASVETIEGAGHWVHAAQPAAFLSVARRFLGCAT